MYRNNSLSTYEKDTQYKLPGSSRLGLCSINTPNIKTKHQYLYQKKVLLYQMQPNSMAKIPNKLPGLGWSFGKSPVISHLPKSIHCHLERIKNNPYNSKSTIIHLYKADLKHDRNIEIRFNICTKKSITLPNATQFNGKDTQ